MKYISAAAGCLKNRPAAVKLFFLRARLVFSTKRVMNFFAGLEFFLRAGLAF
jgi:hypothetical protein